MNALIHSGKESEKTEQYGEKKKWYDKYANSASSPV